MTVPANEPGVNDVVDQGLGLMPDQGQQQQEPQGQPQQDEVKFNPAWNPLLEKLPTQFHNMIASDLKQWDQNYQQGINKVHSQYAGYKPFLDQQIDPNALNEAYMIRQALEQDPMKFVQALVEHYQLQLPTEQGQDPDDQVDEENLYDLTQNPEWQQQQQVVQTMAQAMLLQNQQAQEVQEDQQLEELFQGAKKEHGDFDEDWVSQHLYFSGEDNPSKELMDEAVNAWKQHVQEVVQNYRSPNQNAPVLMGGGGGVPSSATQVGQMTGAQRRALIIQTLQNQAQSGQ